MTYLNSMKTLIDSIKSNRILGKWMIFAFIIFLLINFLHFSTVELILQCTYWNDLYNLLNSILVNILAAYFFYILVVFMPEQKQRLIMRSQLKNRFSEFKQKVIQNLIIVSDLQNAIDSDVLKDIKYFRKVFSTDGITKSLLDPEHRYILNNIFIQLEIFRQDILFVTSKLMMEDGEVLEFLRRLSHILYERSIKHELEYDDIVSLSSFIWEMFAGYNFETGYADKDIIEEILKRL